MRGRIQQVSGQLVIGWLLCISGSATYLLTAEPTVSFWDCGEFIASSYGFQLGHPPGAPLYQLLVHCMQWLAGDDVTRVAFFSNALSALSGGVTVMFLYWSILLTFRLMDVSHRSTLGFHVDSVVAIVGSLCYLFCDTAWSSAVESEVYSLASCIASVLFWAALKWILVTSFADKIRWLCLVALLSGMALCVHLLALLVLPAMLVLGAFSFWKKDEMAFLLRGTRFIPLFVLLFVVGASSYLLVPLRSHVPFPLNGIHSQNVSLDKYNYAWNSGDFSVKKYVTRDNYQKAPIYPRMWRNEENDSLYYAGWAPDKSFVSQVQFFATYQLGYMYFRYLLWNFSGKYNDQQGFGSLQNGQFITGWNFLDRHLVGTSMSPPVSLNTSAHNRYFMIPFLLGLLGACTQFVRCKKAFGAVLSVFLFGGVFLSVFLNHPTYEPRERDYAYVISFYAFAFWIAWGCRAIVRWIGSLRFFSRLGGSRSVAFETIVAFSMLVVPVWMAAENWDDHDRSKRYVAYDVANNMLNSCDNNAILFTIGDNDTFPLWYVQQVENKRPDVSVVNVSLLGSGDFSRLLFESKGKRPVYFSHYAYDRYCHLFENRFAVEGLVYRLSDNSTNPVDTKRFLSLLDGDGPYEISWHCFDDVYVDPVSSSFLARYWKHVLVLVRQLNDSGQHDEASRVIRKTLHEVPLSVIRDVDVVYDIVKESRSAQLSEQFRSMIADQLDYFYSIPVEKQVYIPYSIEPRERIWKIIDE